MLFVGHTQLLDLLSLHSLQSLHSKYIVANSKTLEQFGPLIPADNTNYVWCIKQHQRLRRVQEQVVP